MRFLFSNANYAVRSWQRLTAHPAVREFKSLAEYHHPCSREFTLRASIGERARQGQTFGFGL
jgi:hypothetical protein